MIVVHKKIFKTFFGVMYLYEYKTVNMQMLQYMLALENRVTGRDSTKRT